MSAYDITGFLRTAYRPFAYCVPPKHPLNTAYQKGDVTLMKWVHNTPVTKQNTNNNIARTRVHYLPETTWDIPVSSQISSFCMMIQKNSLWDYVSKSVLQLLQNWSESCSAIYNDVELMGNTTRGPRGPWNAHLRLKIFKSTLFHCFIYNRQHLVGLFLK